MTPFARMLASAFFLALAGCPAEPIDSTYEYDVHDFDATPLPEGGNSTPFGAPSCAPEAVVDFNSRGVRNDARLTITVDTSNAPNNQHSVCVPDDSSEVMLRYRVPDLATRNVQAIRVTTLTDATTYNANIPMGEHSMVDPTAYDTILGIKLFCDSQDIDCDNDGFVQNANGQAVTTRRSTVYFVGTSPEDILFIAVDGYRGSRGTAQVTLDEITELGVVGQPCFPIPPERAQDPTAPTAYFRCPHAGTHCRPGAAPDGTDLCLPEVPLGMRCDRDRRFNVCVRENEGVECAQNPANETQVVCALPGTAPGSHCRGPRGSNNRCDPGLYCSEASQEGDLDTCVEIRHQGDTCDPEDRDAINHCDTGLRCCGDSPDAGAEFYCRPDDGSPCFRPVS